MSDLPAAITEQDAQALIARLAAIEPGRHWVVTCYLKLEPRDRTRGKYLIKMKNRVREREAELARQPLSHEDREAIAASLRQVLDYLEEPNHLPRSRAIAIFASHELPLFETLPLPHVHRSRLAVSHEPLVRELLGLEEEFGTILAVVYDRTAARFFEVTAYDCIELPGLAGIETTRSEEHTSELQSLRHLVCRLLLEKKKNRGAGHPRDTSHRLHPASCETRGFVRKRETKLAPSLDGRQSAIDEQSRERPQTSTSPDVGGHRRWPTTRPEPRTIPTRALPSRIPANPRTASRTAGSAGRAPPWRRRASSCPPSLRPFF